jgi:hypothetical protein
MASIIRIKRSNVSGNPEKLAAGELAYSNVAAVGDFALSGDRLYIGMGSETANNAANHIVIGGKYYTDLLGGTAGILAANKALIVDSSSKIDTLKTTNLQIGGSSKDNTISALDEDGGITLTPDGAGYVTISGSNGLIIPSGDTSQRAPALAGTIRYNTETDAFEGYNNEGWSSLGGVISTDTFTFIKAEATPGDGTLYFNAKNSAGDDTVEVAKLDYNGLNIEAITATTSDGTTGALKVAGGAAIQGNLFVGGNLYGIDNISSGAYVAAEGTPNAGTTGYSFTGDGGYDTGMFSTNDGQLSLYSNNNIVLDIQSSSDVKLNSNLKLGSDGYQVIGQTSSTFFVQPNTDAAATKLEFTLYSSNAVQLASDGGYGLLLGNVDSSDSYINIGGVDGSYWNSPDDIAIKAVRNGTIALKTNNSDITLENNSGTVTFRNSDGHLVIPGTIESTANTGSVTLVASDGTEKNLVFTGAGVLTLPNKGIEFYDTNNIAGTLKGQISFDDELYISSSDNKVIIYANNNPGNTKTWQFNTDGSTNFPDYTFPAGVASSGQVLVDTAGNGTLTWTNGKVTIGTTDISLAGSATVIAGLTDVTIGNINIAGNTVSATNASTDANVVLEPLGAGYVSASNAQIKNVAEPTDDTDAATKYYVDAARSGLDVKVSVRLATTEDITLSGTQTIDTKTTATGDRVLVKDQDLAKNNGIYVVNNSGAWTRATDFDNLANDLTTPLPGEVTGGAFTFVEDGSININCGFVLTNKGEPVLGTDALNWTLFSTSGDLIAGDGLVKDGYTLKVQVAATGGISISDDSLQLSSTVAGEALSLTDGVLDVLYDDTSIGLNTANPQQLEIKSTWTGSTGITTLGTIDTGTWEADTIAYNYGGTGMTSYAKGDILYASDENTLSVIGAGDTGQVLQMNSSGIPVWGDLDGGEYGV